MSVFDSANWIRPQRDYEEILPIFKKEFSISGPIQKATLFISALGVYEAKLNNKRVGEFIMAPGWTVYSKRLQYQEYDITEMIKEHNELNVTIGRGWNTGRLAWSWLANMPRPFNAAMICVVEISYHDGSVEYVYSDDSYQASPSAFLFSEIYDGETYDAQIIPDRWEAAEVFDFTKDILIPQEGEIVKEIESVKPIALIKTPKGETVIDFGQNMTGYVRFKPTGENGDVLEFSHAETLDKDGNFYTENLRTAKQKITYICNGNDDFHKPHFSFQGFRYIRLDKWIGNIEPENFTAIVVHSDMKRTGHFECSNPKINKLYSNIIWGQKSNFLDIPTDCPQRDERLGWTGDAQVFIRAASYNFDVEKFFTKWLGDLAADQPENGIVPNFIPCNVKNDSDKKDSSAGWGDAAVICPWQIYLTYGNKDILKRHFDSMQKWVEYVRTQGDNEFLWNTGNHYGDWLGLDAAEGSYEGKTDKYLIATVYFAYSTGLLVKAGEALGKDMSKYDELYKNIVASFKSTFIKDGALTSNTQTAHALALYFDLCDDKRQISKSLSNLIVSNDNRLTTGFIGTPYLLHALSDNGYEELAYTLLLQEKFPSWLYSVNQGATTIWEHWDGMNKNGDMWSSDMNSFNHYAYGAVADWMYGVMCGINVDEVKPGFKHINFKPKFDKRFDFAKAGIETKYGLVSAEWKLKGAEIEYSVTVPLECTASIYFGGTKEEIGAGVTVRKFSL